MSACRLLLAAASLLPAVAVAADPPPPIVSVPAIGRDWMDAPDPLDRLDDPNPWPRADAAGAGIDDMIHDERHIVDGSIGGVTTNQNRADERILRALKKVGGDYIVVPLLTLHLDRRSGDK